jgi:hypothetical protein
VYFPSNTSHVLQPLDGSPFANYKSSVAKNVSLQSLLSSITGSNEKHKSLLACIESHTNAVTKKSVIEAFKSRGIWPWNSDVALANAARACPQDHFHEAPHQIYDLLFGIKLLEDLKQHFSKEPTVQRKMIQEVNVASPAGKLDSWKPRPRGRPKKLSPIISSEESSSYDEELEFMDDDTSTEEDSNEDPMVPPFQRSVSNNVCSHCSHQRLNGSVPLACFDCNAYWLCVPCSMNTNALAIHQSSHPTVEGRRTRRRNLSLIPPI